jgi:soluble lytic murein transglycosylase-like protein
MQVMPETADWFGPTYLGRRADATQLNDNVELGVAYLGWLRQRASSTEQAVASYYQGLASVRRNGMFDETRQYVRNVLYLVGRV